MILKRCSCTNSFQDARYGVGVRVHNATKDGHCCTVCNVGKKNRQAEWKKSYSTYRPT